ncbi:hypothetical protein D917_04137 [Trichinella nativa]|uniref:Uncharacterized protein n=1 Tax=Trichinella nativa TaxID=6335 RepID=A0A1Y3E944_9BILA|nr:hypothetical protein D917_04137 [Trichinella nativa]
MHIIGSLWSNTAQLFIVFGVVVAYLINELIYSTNSAPAAVERRRLKRVEKLVLVPMVKKVGFWGGGIEGGKRVAIFECNPPPLVQLLVLNFQQQQRAIVDVLH